MTGKTARAERKAETLATLLERAADAPDTGLRILDRGLAPTWMPWPMVVERARSTCCWLRALGVERGDRVALILPTCAAFFDALFGIVLAGAVPVPLYPPVRLGRLGEYRDRTVRMLHAADCCLLLTDRQLYRILGEVVRGARPRLGTHAVPTPVSIGGVQPTTFSPERAAHDLALIQFSSGTTRDPKPVALTNAAVVAQAMLLNSYWPDSDGFRHSGVTWLPLYHDMGLIGCVFTALERPGTLTLIPPELFVARPACWLQTISRYRASISPAPNFAYSLVAQRVTDVELEHLDLSCWKIALCGAEAVVADVMRSFQRRLAPFGFAPEALTPVYGLSEAALAVTFSEPSRRFVSHRFDRDALGRDGMAHEQADGREIVSVGRPVPGFEVRIVSETGELLPEARVGIVECRGPSVMQGYFRSAKAVESGSEQQSAAWREGWLNTGDLGFLWRGELYITGRRKDMLLLRGANHAPEEVELAAGSVEGVRAGCAVAVSWLPEGADGERLVVFVEARAHVGADQYAHVAAECRRVVVASCALLPDEVVVLSAGSLPRTSSGKLRRQDTLAQYLQGTLTPPAPVTAARMAGAVARSTLAHLQARWRRGGDPTA